MIPGRNMKQAKRIDNGELVIGFLVHDDIIRIRKSGFGVQTVYMSTDCEFNGKGVRIDPATIEDVAVKPIPEHDDETQFFQSHCPNCDEVISDFDEPKYCNQCGQRIDWSE